MRRQGKRRRRQKDLRDHLRDHLRDYLNVDFEDHLGGDLRYMSRLHKHATRKSEKIVVRSDGPVYTGGRVESAGYMIHKDDKRCMTACFLVQDVSSLTLYRSELEGVLCLLKHIQQRIIESEEVEQGCNNLRAVQSTSKEILNPKCMEVRGRHYPSSPPGKKGSAQCPTILTGVCPPRHQKKRKESKIEKE